MQLIRTHIDGAYRVGVVTKEGRKWIHFHYVGAPRPVRIPKAAARYFKPMGEVTPKQRRTFNQSAVRFGGKRGAI
jgi:hypothetical protein